MAEQKSNGKRKWVSYVAEQREDEKDSAPFFQITKLCVEYQPQKSELFNHSVFITNKLCVCQFVFFFLEHYQLCCISLFALFFSCQKVLLKRLE